MTPLYKIMLADKTFMGYYYECNIVMENNSKIAYKKFEDWAAAYSSEESRDIPFMTRMLNRFAKNLTEMSLEEQELWFNEMREHGMFEDEELYYLHKYYVPKVGIVPPKFYHTLYCCIDANTFEKQCPNSLITLAEYTHCNDYKGKPICRYDIVRLAPPGLLSSIGGIVYLDAATMSYRIYILPSDLTREWPKTISLHQYQVEVIGNYKEQSLLYPELNEICADIIHATSEDEFSENISKLEPLCTLDFLIEALYSARAFQDPVIRSFERSYFESSIKNAEAICKIGPISEDPISEGSTSGGYFVKTSSTNLAFVDLTELSDIPEKLGWYNDTWSYDSGEMFDIRTNNPLPTLNIGTTLYLYPAPKFQSISSESNVHRQVMLNSSGETSYRTRMIFEDDKVVSTEFPNLYGYVRYLPKYAKYMVEVSDDVFSDVFSDIFSDTFGEISDDLGDTFSNFIPLMRTVIDPKTGQEIYEPRWKLAEPDKDRVKCFDRTL